MTVLTSEEKMILERLADQPQVDRDCIPHRVLVNTGLARRIPVGMIEITEHGRKTLQD